MTKGRVSNSGEAARRSKLPPEAQRALAEAQDRHRQTDVRQKATPNAKEIGGPEGPEPTRYGDWEKKGIASDF